MQNKSIDFTENHMNMKVCVFLLRRSALPTFTRMSVSERHLRVGPEALDVVHRRGSPDAAHALSGGGGREAGDRRRSNKRVVLALLLGLVNGLVRVNPVPGPLGRRVVQRPRDGRGAVAGADEGAGVVSVGGAAALAGGGELVVVRGHGAVAVARRVHHDGVRVLLGQRLLADAQER